jgi:hypothetical protein
MVFFFQKYSTIKFEAKKDIGSYKQAKGLIINFLNHKAMSFLNQISIPPYLFKQMTLKHERE